MFGMVQNECHFFFINFLFIFLSFLKQNISYFLHLDHMFTLIDSLVFSSFLLWATSWPISSLLSHKFQHHWSLSSLYSNLIIKTIYDSIWVISKQSIRVSSWHVGWMGLYFDVANSLKLLPIQSQFCQFAHGFADLFYYYCIQVSSLSSSWFSQYFDFYFYSLSS